MVPGLITSKLFAFATQQSKFARDVGIYKKNEGFISYFNIYEESVV